jgi:hypothetical protein
MPFFGVGSLTACVFWEILMKEEGSKVIKKQRAEDVPKKEREEAEGLGLAEQRHCGWPIRD